MILPWQLSCTSVDSHGQKLLELKLRNNQEILPGTAGATGKIRYHMDISGVLQRPELLEKAQRFIESIGYRFKVPIPHERGLMLFSFSGWPLFSEFQESKANKDYPYHVYYEDAGHWINSATHNKTHAELWEWVGKTMKRIKEKGQEDQRVYLRELVKAFDEERKELDEFYGAQEVPTTVDTMIGIAIERSSK